MSDRSPSSPTGSPPTGSLPSGSPRGSERGASGPSALRRRIERLLAGAAGELPTSPGIRCATRGLDGLLALDALAGAVVYGDRDLAADAAATAETSGQERGSSPAIAVGETTAEANLDTLLPGGLAAAFGRALGGDRVSVYLSTREFVAAGDELARATTQRLPLLVVVAGCSSEAMRAASGSGAVVFAPRNVLRAIDFALAARRLAERALIPVVLLLDQSAVATAIQEAFLPGADTCRRLLGHPADTVHTQGPGEQQLFGAHRRRVPRFVDATRALRLGAEPGALAAASALLAADAFFAGHLRATVTAVLAEVATLTSRPMAALGRLAPLDAPVGKPRRGQVAVVTAGASGEIAANAVAEIEPGSSGNGGADTAVLVLEQLAPWPGRELASELAAMLTDTARVLVVERVDTASAAPALFAEVRTALAASGQSGSHAAASARPPLLAVAPTAAPLCAADLALAIRRLANPAGERERGNWWSSLLPSPSAKAGDNQDREPARRSTDRPAGSPAGGQAGGPMLDPLAADWDGSAGERLVLGSDATADRQLPKLQARRDELARSAPGLVGHGARATAHGRDPRPAGSVTVELRRRAATPSLLPALAELLLATNNGHLRSRTAEQASWAGGWVREVLCWSREPLADLGDRPPADHVIAITDTLPTGGNSALDGDVDDQNAAGTTFDPKATRDAATTSEAWLGAIVATLVARGTLAVTARKLRSAREAQLAGLAEPLRQRLLAALEWGFARPLPAAATTPTTSVASAAATPPIPFAARLTARSGEAGSTKPADRQAWGNPGNFWDEVAQPLRHRPTARLLPTPTLALGAEPALASPFGGAAGRDVPAHLGGRAALTVAPTFAPTLCTGCGNCWALCPHSAIEARWQPTEALLDHALAAAARAGRPAEAIRRFLPKLALRFAAAVAASPPSEAGRELPADALLRAAGQEVLGASADDRTRDALEALAAALGPLALALPKHGGAPAGRAGELVALAIDPDRCTGCDVCVANCQPGALTTATGAADEAASEDELAAAMVAAARLQATAALPATPADVRQRLAADAAVGPVAAALLAPSAVALAGADQAPAGSLARLAVRQTLALASVHLAAPRQALANRLGELSTQLASEIHGVLGRSLPDQDLAALASGLAEIAVPTADLSAVVERLGDAVASERVDVARLRRLVESARALADLQAQLATPTSGGDTRSDLLVVVGGGPALGWARRFPDNPFAVPTLVATVAPLRTAAGLAAAQAERAVAAARVIRRAALELDRPAEARLADELLADLAWSDLTSEEQVLAPAVLVLIDERHEPADASALFALLGGDLRVAVLTLASAESARLHAWTAIAFAANQGLVAHATPAHGEALDAAIAAFAIPPAGARPGRGALIRVLAPPAVATPAPLAGYPLGARGRAADVLDQVRGAVDARRFPLGCHHTAATDGATAPRSLPAPAARTMPSSPAAADGWVDPFAAVAAERIAHAEALAASEARHRGELARLEGELRQRLAGEARGRLLAMLAASRPPEPVSTAVAFGPAVDTAAIASAPPVLTNHAATDSDPSFPTELACSIDGGFGGAAGGACGGCGDLA